jgi:hypothetical protein
MKRLCAIALLAGVNLLAVGPAKNNSYSTAYDNVLPQVADGGGWTTKITLVNMDVVPATFNLWFYADPDGAPWNVGFKGQTGTQSMWTFTIPVGGALFLETPGTADQTSQGWAYLDSPLYWVSGMGTFKATWFPANDAEAVVQFASEIDNHFFIPFENRFGYVTSMAIVNPWPDRNANVAVQFRDPSANIIRTDNFVLAPLQHKGFSTAIQYPESDGKNGVIEFRVTGDVVGQNVGASALALLFSQRNTFSTIPTAAILPVAF